MIVLNKTLEILDENNDPILVVNFHKKEIYAVYDQYSRVYIKFDEFLEFTNKINDIIKLQDK